jgi:hypothetical protein
MVVAEIGTLKRPDSARQASARPALASLLAPIVGGLVVLVTLVGLIGTAIRDPRPHDIPVGIVGPAPAVQRLSAAFGSAAPGAFKVTSYASDDAARAAIDARSVDGVLILGSGQPRLIVAGAAGDGATGVITAAFTNAFKAQGATVAVETVHPFASGDPHGLILFFVVVAALISTLVVQALLLDAGSEAGFAARLGVVVAYGALAGLAGMGAASWIAGGYGSGFWSAAGLVALASAAVGAVIASSGRLLGAAGLGLAALVVVLLDLVSSGGPVGSQLLPDFYRWIAPWMPAGQLYSALRGALYFDGAGLTGSLEVLAGWLLGGLVLMGLGELVARRRRMSQAPAG